MGIKRNFRDFVAKWMMRIKQARGILSLGWWMVMGISTTILAWDFLTTVETVVLLTLLIVGTIVFAYVYDKTRTMKEQNKKKAWRKGNFLNPNWVMFFRFQRFLILAQSKYLTDEDMSYEEYETFVQEESEKLIEQWIEGGV